MGSDAVEMESESIRRLFNPRTDSWQQHFHLQGALIIGITPIGRTTVRVLNMNDPERVELRAAALELRLL